MGYRLNGRLNELERQTEAKLHAQRFLFLTQDYDDKTLYRGRDGIEVRKPSFEFDELSERFQIICINYVDDWRGYVDDNAQNAF